MGPFSHLRLAPEHALVADVASVANLQARPRHLQKKKTDNKTRSPFLSNSCMLRLSRACLGK